MGILTNVHLNIQFYNSCVINIVFLWIIVEKESTQNYTLQVTVHCTISPLDAHYVLMLRCSLMVHLFSFHLSVFFLFPLLPISFFYCLTRYLISCFLPTLNSGWWWSMQQKEPIKDSLCCLNALLAKLTGEIWLSHSNLCIVKHSWWAWMGRE